MTGSSLPGSRRCGMLNQVLDELEKPDAAGSCQKSNSSYSSRTHGQHDRESRQPAAARSSKMAFAEPEIVISDHGCHLRTNSRADVRLMFYCS